MLEPRECRRVRWQKATARQLRIIRKSAGGPRSARPPGYGQGDGTRWRGRRNPADQLPGSAADESLEDIDWDTFFKKFEDSNLAFACQDETVEGEESRFGKFVGREDAPRIRQAIDTVLADGYYRNAAQAVAADMAALRTPDLRTPGPVRPP